MRLGFDCSAHAFSVQFATFEKFEYLVCGQRKVLVYWEDYVATGRLHRETYSHSMLPQQVDRPDNIIRSLCKIAHDKLSETDIIAEMEEPV